MKSLFKSVIITSLFVLATTNTFSQTASKEVSITVSGSGKTLEDAKLSIVKVVKPGEDGSTSGLLRTYIVQDENKNEYRSAMLKLNSSLLKPFGLIIGSFSLGLISGFFYPILIPVSAAYFINQLKED